MKITFKINYRTQFGQQMEIEGINGNSSAVMFPGENGDWFYCLDTNSKTNSFEYKYVMRDTNTGTSLKEFDKRTFLLPHIKTDNVYVRDFWKPQQSIQNTLLSSAFKDVIFHRYNKENFGWLIKTDTSKTAVRFTIPLVRVSGDNYVAVKIIGNLPENDVIIKLSDEFFPFWSAEFLTDKPEQYSEYKYCICDKKNDKIILEEYVTRFFNPEEYSDKSFYIYNDEDFKFPRYPWKGAGVAVPVFSLRTDDGLGTGEFYDLIKLVDWAVKTGLKLIQILPVNDTVLTHTYTDSYPYAAVSVYALHPLYLRLEDMGQSSSTVRMEILQEHKTKLNALEKVDYEEVMKIKSRYIKIFYDENKREFLNESQYKEFFEKNKTWLKPYAVFSYLRDLYNTPDFSKWGNFATYSDKIVEDLCNPEAVEFDDIAIHFFIHYHLNLQLKKVSEYARAKGIVLKGDIPIGIHRFSVDAWSKPNLFFLNVGAGAPPDDFSEDGQNWGFPTYNWQEMAKDNFTWWKNRLIKMREYFDAYRIDHILGFFRIWQVPLNQTRGIMGVFNPALPIKFEEFASHGINFNRERFCTPYIRDYMLRKYFGDAVGYVKHSFLTDYAPGCYKLLPEYATQAAIEKSFAEMCVPTAEEIIAFQKIKQGLLSLASEVLFFADEKDENAFHPRHSMFKTDSFKDLDDETRRLTADIYNDYFYRRNEGLWKNQAEIKLPAICSATEMLVCGEDLGMIPACVPEVMRNLNILSLEIQRMPKARDLEFGRPADYPYLSVATPSSHDTSTIRGWWEEDHARSQRFFNNSLGKTGNAPYFCETWVVKDIILQHLYSPSMWAIFPIQDFLSLNDKLRRDNPEDDRINVPSESNRYWRFRCNIALEDLLKADTFNNEIMQMVNLSGRNSAY